MAHRVLPIQNEYKVKWFSTFQHNNCANREQFNIIIVKVLVLFLKMKRNKVFNDQPSFRVPTVGNSLCSVSYSLVIRFHGDDPLAQALSSSGCCFDLIRVKLGV